MVIQEHGFGKAYIKSGHTKGWNIQWDSDTWTTEDLTGGSSVSMGVATPGSRRNQGWVKDRSSNLLLMSMGISTQGYRLHFIRKVELLNWVSTSQTSQTVDFDYFYFGHWAPPFMNR